MDPQAVVSSRVCSADLFAAMGQVTVVHPPAAMFEELDALLDTLQRYGLKLQQLLFTEVSFCGLIKGISRTFACCVWS